MTIQEVYLRCAVPANLQLHMLRVAALGTLILDNWKGEGIHRERVVSALVLHDLGNVVKFDWASQINDNQNENSKNTQKKLHERFGKDEHLATRTLALESGATAEVVELIEAMGTSNAPHLALTTDHEAILCTYADSRIDPHGVVSIDERWDEILARYKTHTFHPLRDAAEVERRRAGCLDLEKIIQKNCSIDLQEIDNSMIAPLIEQLRTTTI